jgi:hypothetical protein
MGRDSEPLPPVRIADATFDFSLSAFSLVLIPKKVEPDDFMKYSGEDPVPGLLRPRLAQDAFRAGWSYRV